MPDNPPGRIIPSYYVMRIRSSYRGQPRAVSRRVVKMHVLVLLQPTVTLGLVRFEIFMARRSLCSIIQAVS